MQIGADVKCMHTSFGGCGLSGFGDKISFQFCPNFPLEREKIELNRIGSKIYASRSCQMHTHQF